MIKKIKKQIAELDAVLSNEIERRWALEKELAAIKCKLFTKQKTEVKVGDTIKCNDMPDLWSTKNELERIGIYTDIVFPVSEFTLKVWKVTEKNGS